MIDDTDMVKLAQAFSRDGKFDEEAFADAFGKEFFNAIREAETKARYEQSYAPSVGGIVRRTMRKIVDAFLVMAHALRGVEDVHGAGKA